jgi:hypothetical protein
MFRFRQRKYELSLKRTYFTRTSYLAPALRFVITILIAGLGAASVTALGQKKTSLPGNLNQNSTVSEIVTWLDQTTFRNVNVVLKDSWDDTDHSPPWDDTTAAKNTFIFTRGFRVTSIDGCNLMLRHDDARTISKGKVNDFSQHVVAEVWVQLNRMSSDKGRHTHRYTSDPEKIKLTGAWRSEFRYYGWFSRTIVGLHLNSPDWKEPQRWEGMNVAFTFDTKQMGEQFDVAFRRAIKLCRAK